MNRLQLPLHRSKSVKQDKYSGYGSRRSNSQNRGNRREEYGYVSMESKKSRTEAKENMVKKSTLEDRPPFNLDTRIDGYDDVDENGRYRKKYNNQPIRKDNKHDDYGAAWVNSLRGSYTAPNAKKMEF